MALFFADLVREASWGTGTADLPLGGALPGHRTFAAAVPPGARFHYAIAGVTHPGEWETGEGEIGSGGTLIRLAAASSADGAAVSFSTGLKTVALTVNADWFASRDGGLAAIEDVTGLPEALAAKADGDHAHDLDYAPAGHGHAFADLTGRPGTLSGYGIVDAQPLDTDLSAIAALTTSIFGRAHLTLADGAALRSHAGLGSAAVHATGTSGANVPLLDGANLWSAVQTFGAGAHIEGGALTFSWGAAHDWFAGTRFSTFYENGIHLLEATRETRLVAKAADNSGIISFHTGETPDLRGRFSDDGLAVNGRVTVDGLELGYRDVPRVTAGLERGKCLAAASEVAVSAGAVAGSTYTIYNDSASPISITQGAGLTLRQAGTGSAGNRTLAARGLATIWFNAANEAVIAGFGLS